MKKSRIKITILVPILILTYLVSGCAGDGFSIWDGSAGPGMIAKGEDHKEKWTNQFKQLIAEAEAETLDAESEKAYREAIARFYDLISAMSIHLNREGYASLATAATTEANRFKLRGTSVAKHAAILNHLAKTVEAQHEAFWNHDKAVDGTYAKQYSAFEFNIHSDVLSANLDTAMKALE